MFVAENEAEAQARAGDLLADAQARFDEAQRRGREQGLRDAAAQWTAQALDAAEATRRGLVRQSDRLSAIVSLAIERVIEQEDRAALFRRSRIVATGLACGHSPCICSHALRRVYSRH